MSKATGYKQVALPAELVDEIKKFVEKNKHHGYMSVPEFIREAIRFYLRDINKNNK
jgi:metal-responsive CopG/Arc/MetJ family transcriptional regulator